MWPTCLQVRSSVGSQGRDQLGSWSWTSRCRFVHLSVRIHRSFAPGLAPAPAWGVIESPSYCARSTSVCGRSSSAGRHPAGGAAACASMKGWQRCAWRLRAGEEDAVEQTFVNKPTGASTPKLGQASGVAMLRPAQIGIRGRRYAPNQRQEDRRRRGPCRQESDRVMLGVLLPKASRNPPTPPKHWPSRSARASRSDRAPCS